MTKEEYYEIWQILNAILDAAKKGDTLTEKYERLHLDDQLRSMVVNWHDDETDD